MRGSRKNFPGGGVFDGYLSFPEADMRHIFGNSYSVNVKEFKFEGGGVRTYTRAWGIILFFATPSFHRRNKLVWTFFLNS